MIFVGNEGAGFASDGVAFLYGRCVWHTYFKDTYFKHTFPKELQLHQMQSQVYYKQERIYAPDTNDFLEYRNWEEISQFIEQANNYHASKV